jgi:hypothetical protein
LLAKLARGTRRIGVRVEGAKIPPERPREVGTGLEPPRLAASRESPLQGTDVSRKLLFLLLLLLL